MPVKVVVGLQWGDEGKGKVVQVLAREVSGVIRFQGGPNAGHTLFVQNQKLVLHNLPSGVVHPHTWNYLGAGVVVNPLTLQEELLSLTKLGISWKGRLYADARVHLILPTHIALDWAAEQMKGRERIGSTLRGIGPAYMDRTGRNGLRLADLFLSRKAFLQKYYALRDKHLRMIDCWKLSIPFDLNESQWLEAVFRLPDQIQIVNGPYWLAKRVSCEPVLVEGAQGILLDNTFGTYPYVTSSLTMASASAPLLGIPASWIQEVYGVAKAYTTRVGRGPFPTECSPDEAEWFRNEGNEYGSTTGRPRRCGWLDLVALRYACMMNGVSALILTKVDILLRRESFRVAVRYRHRQTGAISKEFPPSELEAWEPVLREYPADLDILVRLIEEHTGIPVRFVSTGPHETDWLSLESTPG